jgi:hypothetical protein
MSNDFGLVNSIAPPFLERIEREEPLNRDQPRARTDSQEDDGNSSAADNEQNNSPVSSKHIDLRI